MTLVKRLVKGSAITAAEHDGNMDHVLDMDNMIEGTNAKVLTAAERTAISGALIGPAGGTVDNEIVLYDDTTGKLAKGSGVLIGDVYLTVETTTRTSNFTAAAQTQYVIGTTGARTVTLPEGNDGDFIKFLAATNSWATNSLTLSRSGTDTIQGSASNFVISDGTWATAAFQDGNWIIGLPGGTGSGDLLAANNLDDLANVATARTNLGVYSTTESDAAALAQIEDAINALGELAEADYTNLTQTGSGAPSVNARWHGDTYRNTDNGDIYVASRTNGIGNTPASDDWDLDVNQTVAQRQADLNVDTFEIEIPVAGEDGTYTLVARNFSIDTIAGASFALAGGTTPTTDVVIQIADQDGTNGTAVTGLGSGTALDISATWQDFTATAANTVARAGTTDRQVLAVVTNTTGTPDELLIVLRCTRPSA